MVKLFLCLNNRRKMSMSLFEIKDFELKIYSRFQHIRVNQICLKLEKNSDIRRRI